MRHQLAGNVIWNWAGMGITMLTGFIVAPYLVHRLGDTAYGLWILIASMSGYFGLLDLGVRGSVGRYVAFHRAKGEQGEINRTISTALAILCGVGVLSLAATAAVLGVFFHLFDVPPESVAVAKTAILIIGINLAISFPVSAFDGVLWGMERFDLINAIEIPTAVARTAATFWLVRGPEDLAALAWITLLSTAANEAAKLITSFRVNRGLTLGWRWVDRAHARQLYGYGIWQFLLQIARQSATQVGPTVVGAVIAVAAVTPYSIALRLIGYASAFMVAATGVMTPLATALHAKSDHEGERRLFVEGGKWCTVFALFAAIALVGLGKPFVELWMGKSLVAAAMPVLVVLTAGELLAMSQWLGYSVILGKAMHRAVAIASITEGLVAGVGSILAAKAFGVMGVCVVFALAAFCFRGVFQVWYSCRAVRVGVGEYVAETLLLPAAAALLPALLLWGIAWWRPPGSWGTLLGYALGYTVVYAATVGLALAGDRLWARVSEPSLADRKVENVHG